MTSILETFLHESMEGTSNPLRVNLQEKVSETRRQLEHKSCKSSPCWASAPRANKKMHCFFRTSLRMLSDVIFCHKIVIKSVWVQNCQFGNFLTALGKCQLLNRMIHSRSWVALLGVGSYSQQEDALFLLGFTQNAFNVKFCHKIVIKSVLVQGCQFENFLPTLGKCQLLNRMTHIIWVALLATGC